MHSIYGQCSVDSGASYIWPSVSGSVDLSKTALLIREVSFYLITYLILNDFFFKYNLNFLYNFIYCFKIKVNLKIF